MQSSYRLLSNTLYCWVLTSRPLAALFSFFAAAASSLFLTLRQFLPHWRKYYAPDLYEQLQVPLVIPDNSRALQLADLGITPKTLNECIAFSLKTADQREIEFNPHANL